VLLEIGYVGRAHGLHGEVVVQLVSNVASRLGPGSTFETKQGRLVVESSRPVPGKSGPHISHWVVRFSGVGSREQAEALKGAVLQAEAENGAEGLWVHELIGSKVVSVDGEQRGTVVSVQANPASDLLVLDTGALVPLRFVLSAAPGQVTVDVPSGLFDL